LTPVTATTNILAMPTRPAGPPRIHIVGASGSGTTTLGRALAARLDCPHLDTDDYFWLPSDPPFQHVRPRAERQTLLGAALPGSAGWVLSGSLCGWGDVFIPRFELVIFLWVPPDVRLARLRARERDRHGSAVDPGGPLHARSEAFIAWAAGYDERLEPPERCRRLHEQWLAALPCPVLRLEDDASVEERLERIGYHLGRQRSGGGP
jgi:adenylate kinase family enzyme